MAKLDKQPSLWNHLSTRFDSPYSAIFKACLCIVFSVIDGGCFPLFTLSLYHTKLLDIKTYKNIFNFSVSIYFVETHT